MAKVHYIGTTPNGLKGRGIATTFVLNIIVLAPTSPSRRGRRLYEDIATRPQGAYKFA